MREIIRASDPKVIVCTAGNTKLAHCDAEPQLARQVNYEAPMRLAEIAKERRARLVLFSSETVYVRTSNGPHPEGKMPEIPTGVYAQTKYELERDLGDIEGVIVARIPNVIGGAPKNGEKVPDRFYNRIVEALQAGKKYNAYIDCINSPVVYTDVVAGILYLISQGVSGLVNLAGPEALSRYYSARKIARANNLPEELVVPVNCTDPNYGRDTSLVINRLNEYGYFPRPIHEALPEAL